MEKEGGRGVETWIADGQRGCMLLRGDGCQRLGPPGCALCAGLGRVFCAGQKRCICYERETGRALFDFSIPGGVCALEFLRERVYALSADADSLSAYSAWNGELLFSAPAGVYPRGMALSPCGRYLAVAGGAAGEILLLDDLLQDHARHRVAGVACAVAFFPRMLGVLCAVGEMELSARFVGISQRGVAEELLALPAPPCALCARPGGGCLLGCHGMLYSLRADGKISRGMPWGYPAKIRSFRQHALICDPWQRDVRLLKGERIYEGAAPEDALLFL